ncbi:MAG: FMN-binding negative transcriptional regulator [Terriglobia bacterium]|nr:FMN-binding negative transcriptional regulator [Terriglobia bacterium]
MFVRPCWKPHSCEELFAFIDAYPWALLINNGADGPLATNLPLLLDRSRGSNGTLVGHIARANEHSRILKNVDTPTLAIFQGPYSFVSGSWYPNRDMPSTYYYTAVHCYGRIRLQTESELEHWVGVLTNRFESEFPNGWKMTDVPYSDITRRLPSISGFELEIERMEGKFKLGQDEPKKDAMAVCTRLEQSPDPSLRELASLVRRYNSDREEK